MQLTHKIKTCMSTYVLWDISGLQCSWFYNDFMMMMMQCVITEDHEKHPGGRLWICVIFISELIHKILRIVSDEIFA